jgi:hypothetical protein
VIVSTFTKYFYACNTSFTIKCGDDFPSGAINNVLQLFVLVMKIYAAYFGLLYTGEFVILMVPSGELIGEMVIIVEYLKTIP